MAGDPGGKVPGGIYNDFGGMLAVNNSAIIGNTASYGAGGISDNGGTINLSGDAIIGNQPDNCEPADTIPSIAAERSYRRH